MQFYTENAKKFAAADIDRCIEMVMNSDIHPYNKDKIRYYLINYKWEIESQPIICKDNK